MAAAGQEEYAYLYKDSAHPGGFLEAFRAFYLDGLFTDITLQCASGVIFHCHRAALAACSSYFKAMFTADMKEKSKNQISLPGLSHAVLEALVNYVYTSQIQITKRNVQSLLQAADLLQFVSVKKACEQFLVRHLDTDNCIGMHSFAEYHDCPELEKESRRILLWQFEEVWKQEEFLDIGKDKLSYILSRENLNVQKEEVAIEAVIKWVAHNVEGRVEDICEVLSCIKVDLDNVYLRSALSLQKKCRLNDSKIRSLIYNALNLKPKGLSRRSTAAMYVIGGYYWHPLSEVHVWDPLTNAWVQGTEMPDHTRESYGVTSLGPDIYVTGGYRTESIEALDTVWIYNSERDEWTEGCPMLDARYYHCAVSLSGCIYALGGYRKGAPVQEAEFYDPLIQKWLPIANMIKGVGNATACVLHEVIYVAGGHYGYRGSCTYDKIQRYHSGSNEWSIVTTSPHPEYGLCSITLQNKIYFVGGQTTITDCYDPEQNEWKQMAHMMERRMECGTVVMNGCIYVTGGYSYSKGTYLQSIEKYDPELNKWEALVKMAENGNGENMSILESKICQQIEYYFGNHNLPRDKFLKEQIKLDDGWVPLEVMIKFNRLSRLSKDFDVIVEALRKSKTGLMEINEDKTKIRRSPNKPLPELNDQYKAAIKNRSVYVKGFPLDATLDDIKEWLEDKGPVENIQMRRTLQRTFKGSIFAVFDSVESAKKFTEIPNQKYKDTELIVLFKEEYCTKKNEERKQNKVEAKARAKQEKEEKQKQAADAEMKSLEEKTGCLLKFSGDLDDQTCREDLHDVFSGHGEIKWIHFVRGAKEGIILFKDVAKEALEKAKAAHNGNLQLRNKDVSWEVLEGDAEKEALKKILEDQQELLKQKTKGRKIKGKGRGGKIPQGGQKGKIQFQGKKIKFENDEEDGENDTKTEPASPKKRPLEVTEKEEPAPKQLKTENGDGNQ
ncbi:kelch-like protein 23 [Turdus rufiventris]|nr:kelch-like protein 23 [Turdus rufiventris]